MKKLVSYFVIVILLILGVTFAVLNATPVKVNYYVATEQVALSLLLAIGFALGVLVGIGVLIMKLLRLRFENGRLRRQVNKYQKEIAAIRSLTEEDDNE